MQDKIHVNEVRNTLKLIKQAIIQANESQQYSRVDYLKYCKRRIRSRLHQWYLDNHLTLKE